MVEYWVNGFKGKMESVIEAYDQHSIIPISHFAQAENKLEAILKYRDVE